MTKKLLHASHLPPEFELCHCTKQFTILFHIYVMPFAAKNVDLPFEAENVDVWDALQKQGPACRINCQVTLYLTISRWSSTAEDDDGQVIFKSSKNHSDLVSLWDWLCVTTGYRSNPLRDLEGAVEGPLRAPSAMALRPCLLGASTVLYSSIPYGSTYSRLVWCTLSNRFHPPSMLQQDWDLTVFLSYLPNFHHHFHLVSPNLLTQSLAGSSWDCTIKLCSPVRVGTVIVTAEQRLSSGIYLLIILKRPNWSQ